MTTAVSKDRSANKENPLANTFVRSWGSSSVRFLAKSSVRSMANPIVRSLANPAVRSLANSKRQVRK